MNGPINTASENAQQAGGYAAGYAVIAGALCLSLLVTLPLAALPLARLFAAAGLLLAGH